MYRLSNHRQTTCQKSKGEPDMQRVSSQMVLRKERQGQGRRRDASKDLRRIMTKARDLCRAGGPGRSAGSILCA